MERAAACRGQPALSEAAVRAARVIERYAPVSLSAAAADFTRAVVARAGPATPARAKALLFAAGRLAGFTELVGLELSSDVVLREATIERFIAVGCPVVSPATRRTLRTNLRAIARAIERYPQPAAVPLVRERARRPYSPTEIAGFLRLADAQSTHARRMRATALICLGAGAGLITGELRHVRGTDVLARAGGLLVEVGALPRFQAGRLRSTWLMECAERIGLGAFMHAAGISCSQRLGDLAAQLPAVSEDELIRRLGGTR
jgi:integrase